jgi:hypothetical protein
LAPTCWSFPRPLAGAGIGGYHYAQIGSSGIPGSWTKVVTGFQANKEPTDILVFSPSEIYFSANGGYIYKCTDLTAGVTVINAGATTTSNLLRIQGNRNLIVAVGATGSIIYSANSGRSWATTTSTPAASNPTWQAVDIIGAKGIWVGSATGRLFYTLDGGVTWTEKTFDQSSTGAITDVYFVNAHEGYFVHTVSSVWGASSAPSPAASPGGTPARLLRVLAPLPAWVGSQRRRWVTKP